jgi:hypothetical protein
MSIVMKGVEKINVLRYLYFLTEQFNIALEHIRSAEELGYPVDQELIDNLKKKTR